MLLMGCRNPQPRHWLFISVMVCGYIKHHMESVPVQLWHSFCLPLYGSWPCGTVLGVAWWCGSCEAAFMSAASCITRPFMVRRLSGLRVGWQSIRWTCLGCGWWLACALGQGACCSRGCPCAHLQINVCNLRACGPQRIWGKGGRVLNISCLFVGLIPRVQVGIQLCGSLLYMQTVSQQL